MLAYAKCLFVFIFHRIRAILYDLDFTSFTNNALGSSPTPLIFY